MRFFLAASLSLLCLPAAPQEAAAAKPEAKAEAKLETKIVDLPAKTLVGLQVRSSMGKFAQDGQALWQAFAPRVNEAAADPRETFGVIIKLGGDEFEYWAAVEAALPTEGPLPAHMKKLEIPAGTYVACAVPSMEQVGAAYGHIYGEWARANPANPPEHGRPYLELYPRPGGPGAPMHIYVPVKKAEK
jgi:AraC family transcriptional regulator